MTKEKMIDSVKKFTISIIAGIMISLFSFYLARKAYGHDKMQEALKQKVDKLEFKEYKTDHQIQHDLEKENREAIKEHIDTRFEDFKDWYLLQSN